MRRAYRHCVTMILACVVLLSAVLTPIAAVPGLSFSDVPPTYWGYQTIMAMTEYGLFKGTAEPVNGVGVFSPETLMTRAEFVTAALRAIIPVEAALVDTKMVPWWNGYYKLALSQGLLLPTELDNGDLGKPMSREEMAMVLVRCVEKNGEKLEKRVAVSQIADYTDITGYYQSYVRDCFSFGLLTGVDQIGTFAPMKALTRAEAATVLCRLVDTDMRVKVQIIETGYLEALMPWEYDGKDPEDYTWDEYENLSTAEQEAFFESFDSVKAFERWMDKVLEALELPWENGGKQPEDYSWEEYEALSADQQEAFKESFFSDASFRAWKTRAQKPAKEPQDGNVTLNDYEKMTDMEKEAFQESMDDFAAWLEEQQALANGKKPEDYTWAEYEKMTPDQQETFQERFSSIDAFVAWMYKAQLPWYNGGKKPEKYTWAEYQTLSPDQQEAFFEYFAQIEDFEAWMDKVQ